MARETNANQVKKVGIEVGTIVTVILTYLSIGNAGLLSGIEHVKIWTYTVPQFIFLIILFLGVGLILGDLLLGRSKEDVSKDLKKLFGDSLNMSDKELSRLQKDVKEHYKNSLSETIKSSDKVSTYLINFAEADFMYPTTEQLRNLFVTYLESIIPSPEDFQIFAIPIDEVDEASKGGVIPIVEAQAENAAELIPAKAYTKQKIIITAIFLIVAIIIFFIGKFGGL